MIGDFILGVYLMVGLLIFLAVLFAYGMLIRYQIKNRSRLLVVTVGLPALLLLAGVAGVVFA